MSGYDDWFKRRRRWFPFFGGDFEEIDKMMEEMFRQMQEEIPKDLVRERKLPDGRVVRETGPFIFGYSMSMGPDGKPVIREFGNVKPSMRHTAWGMPKPSIELKEDREPLVDIMEGESEVRVVAELPGVDKEDINLQSTGTTLTISVETAKRKYHKEIELPAKVDYKSAVAKYNNGVLEVTLKKLEERKPRGEAIKIE